MLKKNMDWRRRILTTSIWMMLAWFITFSLPFWMFLGFILDLMMPKKTAYMRTVIFFWAYFMIEARALIFIIGVWVLRPLFFQDPVVYNRLNRTVQRQWASSLFWTSIKIYAADVKIEGLEALENPRPVLLLSRHVSTLDTMLPLALTWKRKMKDIRYVLKAELLLEPCLDIGAQRLPNYFVRRGGDQEKEIAGILKLRENLGEDGVIVIYPEGTRFSEKKRAKLLEKFETKNSPLLETARLLTHTLPPIRDGVIRLVETMREEDIIFVAHRGMDKTESMASLFSGSLFHAKIEIRLWRIPANAVPREPEAIREFLIENWKEINAFVVRDL